MSTNAWLKDISNNGAARMIEVLTSKLNEMTGTDNRILAEYVVILVQRGKTEEEIKNDLKTFLGDKSGSFVSWLSDHLASHMHHYTSPQPKITCKEDQTTSSVNAKFLGDSLVSSSNNEDKGAEDRADGDTSTDTARKSVFERLGKFHEWNTNYHGEVTNSNKKRSRPNCPFSLYGNDRTISGADFRTPKKLKVEYNRELPVTPVVAAGPTKSIRTPASTRKVFGTTRNTATKAKRISVFDRLGEKIDPQTERLKRVDVNEGNKTSQNPETKNVFVSNVHFGATSQALTRHFMQCGQVTRVHMINNTSTGFPTGTAIVEFASKEGAQRALSMDGLSFMYRILQVKPKSPAQTTTGRQQEQIHSSRNFQWRRDTPTPDSLANSRNSATPSNITNSRRQLTYRRNPPQKPNPSSWKY